MSQLRSYLTLTLCTALLAACNTLSSEERYPQAPTSSASLSSEAQASSSSANTPSTDTARLIVGTPQYTAVLIPRMLAAGSYKQGVIRIPVTNNGNDSRKINTSCALYMLGYCTNTFFYVTPGKTDTLRISPPYVDTYQTHSGDSVPRQATLEVWISTLDGTQHYNSYSVTLQPYSTMVWYIEKNGQYTTYPSLLADYLSPTFNLEKLSENDSSTHAEELYKKLAPRLPHLKADSLFNISLSEGNYSLQQIHTPSETQTRAKATTTEAALLYAQYLHSAKRKPQFIRTRDGQSYIGWRDPSGSLQHIAFPSGKTLTFAQALVVGDSLHKVYTTKSTTTLLEISNNVK